MLFLVIGRDGTDAGALDRRMAARADHIALGEKMRQAGQMWYGAAMWDDDERMIGSMLVMNFPSRKELDAWLKVEPYVTGKVWEQLEVTRCNVRDPWQYSFPREWFEAHT